MKFKHVRVDATEQKTKEVLGRLSAIVTTVGEGDGERGPHVDGIPVSRELARFCGEIRKVNRHVKFGITESNNSAWEWQNSFRVAKELSVYMDGHTYTLMRVGVGDYSTKSNGGSKFMVYARTIENDKFKGDRDQYHMAMAETVERALKNVKKYMRPYSPVECADISYGSIRDKFNNIKYSASSSSSNAREGVTTSGSLRTELFHMLDVGYEFLSEEFRNKIVAWREKYNENRVFSDRALHVYYVAVRIDRDEMMCDVIEVLDAQKVSCIDKGAPTVTYKMNELPEHIAGNLAALSMVEDGHYVDGVGLRVDSTTFWVQR